MAHGLELNSSRLIRGVVVRCTLGCETIVFNAVPHKRLQLTRHTVAWLRVFVPSRSSQYEKLSAGRDIDSVSKQEITYCSSTRT